MLHIFGFIISDTIEQYVIYALIGLGGLLVVGLAVMYIRNRPRKWRGREVNPPVQKRSVLRGYARFRAALYGPFNGREIKEKRVEKKYSFFHFYRVDKQLHPELYAPKARLPGEEGQTVSLEYRPRFVRKEKIDDNPCTFTREEVLAKIAEIVETNKSLRKQMFLSSPRPGPSEAPLLAETIEEIAERCAIINRAVRLAAREMEEIETRLDQLYAAKKRDKLDIATARALYHEKKHSLETAEAEMTAFNDQQKYETEVLWKYLCRTQNEIQSMEAKIQEKLEYNKVDENDTEMMVTDHTCIPTY